MIILDENILNGQRLLLEASRLAAKQIGVNIGRKGLKDEEIVVLLRQQRYPTFFTRDAGFYHPALRHRSYCLVVTSVGQSEVATFIRRFLRHPDFDTGRRGWAGWFGYRTPALRYGACGRKPKFAPYGVGRGSAARRYGGTSDLRVDC